MRQRKVVVDLFCGAGGSSEAAEQAMAELGHDVDLVCINHWGVALETHQRNHPRARHICADISQVRPHQIIPGLRVDLLMASPTCTHHSVARGGKPTSDQQRSDPWHVIPWLTELTVDRMLIENVREFVKWGPVDPQTRRPIKAREGEFYDLWIDTIRRVGATSYDWGFYNSANQGAATTRQRYFGFFKFNGRRSVLPVVTHARRDRAGAEGLLPWRPAREIIDWSIKGKSIFKRPVPLAPKTLARILAGALKFGWPDILIAMLIAEQQRALLHALRFAFARRHARRADLRERNRKRVGKYVAWLRDIRSGEVRGGPGPASPIVVTLRNNVVARSMGQPVPALAACGQHVGLAEPIILKQSFRRDVQSVEEPAPTATTVARIGIVEPFVLSRHADGAPRSTSEPTPTQVAKHSHVLISPYYGSGSGETLRSAEQPLPTATAKARFGMVVPITHSDTSNRARDVDVDPLSTLTTANRGELAFITAQFGERDGQAPRVHGLEQPAPAVTATGHINLVEAVLLPSGHVDTSEADILFRMFVPHELAAAMSFPPGYHFAGTKTDQVKQIGNAVEVRQMKANVLAIMDDGEAAEPEFLEAAE
ncbi:site-specific DNA methylase [Bradyrhizobium sp. YR681]|uniref:DNA cytosine methyltransferase n=1 Tax=Bradyrhizobium sp. YR681 TaxID=1144344 RepID=UPI000270E696|nr:DNA cytosine methyltransferase [Bradyrhizobium sp. YR681]EJN15712.1 site-specific DNA methylase [Bradyrhizobium sp. YR681]